MNLNLKNTFHLPRTLVKTLTDGFLEIFGEEHRTFFESIQDGMIQNGYNADKKASHINGLGSVKSIKIDIKHSKPEELKNKIENQLKDFYGESDANLILSKKLERPTSGLGVTGAYSYYKDLEKYTTMFIKQLCKGDHYENIPKLYKKSSVNFKKFKQFKHYVDLDMYGGGGLELDNWSSGDINYTLEDNEFFYYIENITRKYYLLGAFLGKQDVKEEWIKIGLEKINPDTDKSIISSWKSYLDVVSFRIEEETLVNIVRDSYKRKYKEDLNDLLMTHKEISDFLNTHDFSDLPDNLFKD